MITSIFYLMLTESIQLKDCNLRNSTFAISLRCRKQKTYSGRGKQANNQMILKSTADSLLNLLCSVNEIYTSCKLEQFNMNICKLLNNNRRTEGVFESWRCLGRLPGASIHHNYRISLIAAAALVQFKKRNPQNSR